MSFEQFGEEARLYAEYAPVVDKMREIFRAELKAFIAALSDAVRVALPSRTVQTDATGANYYLWIGPDANADEANPPAQLWGVCMDPKIVVPGIIELWAAAPALSGEQLVALRTVAHEPKIAEYCSTKEGGKKWYLFKVSVPFGADKPVEAAAHVIASVLDLLTSEHERVRTSEGAAR